MSVNNLILNMGMEAFEEPSLPAPVDAVYDAPVDVDVANAMVVDRNVAVEDAQIAQAELGMQAQATELATYDQQLDTIQNLQASMEAFMTVGITPAVAELLHGQITASLEALGIDATQVGGGLESFDNDEASLAYLNAGLEALNDAKGTIGTKVAGAIVGINTMMTRFIDGIVLKAGRLKKRAEGIITDAQKATGTRQVKVKSKYLAVKGDKVTTNLVGDLGGFTKMVTDLSGDYMQKVGSFANGPVNSAMSSLKSAATLADAKKIIDKLVPPPYPGSNISVQDTPALTLKRTEVSLGGYAVFDLRYKTTGGDSVGEIASTIKALGKARVALRRPKEEKSDKVVFEATLTPQDAVKIANEVIKACNATLAIQRNVKMTMGFFGKLANHTIGLNEAMKTSSGADKGVATLVYTLSKLPTSMIDGVRELVRGIPNAVGEVGGAALDVAAQAAKGGEAQSE